MCECVTWVLSSLYAFFYTYVHVHTVNSLETSSNYDKCAMKKYIYINQISNNNNNNKVQPSRSNIFG